MKKVADNAVADRRTVRKFLDGQPIRGAVAVRIEDELKRQGLI